MHNALRVLVKETLKRFNIGILSYSRLQRLEASSNVGADIGLLLELPERQSASLLDALRHSKSQLGQDLFVLSALDFKREGFFVEFGATNGVELSNTYLLEREFGWSGILAEPARLWHEDLRTNRRCNIETDCVWRESNSTLVFNETDLGELSTIGSCRPLDPHRQTRESGKKYNVHTISLKDMLNKFNAPREIDYLSIDTEGSEYEILSNFDWDKYQFNAITCEHNFTPQREKIFALLSRNGYVRKLERFSRFDDWYVRAGSAQSIPSV
jgi:FkbM family methyltransferase